jgi:hypothetical protein
MRPWCRCRILQQGSRARILELPLRYGLEVNFTFVIAGLRKAVGRLKLQPRFRAAAKMP